MSRAELLLWPEINSWGAPRRAALLQHLALYAVLYPDELTCAIWVEVVANCRSAGKPIHIAAAWIAAIARQWSLTLVTADLRDFERVEDLSIVLVRQ
jgi:predicted nucleic acid-binding protein